MVPGEALGGVPPAADDRRPGRPEHPAGWTVTALCLLAGLAPFNLALRSAPAVLLLPLVVASHTIGLAVIVRLLRPASLAVPGSRLRWVVGLVVVLLALIWLSALTSDELAPAAAGGARVSVMPVIALATALAVAADPSGWRHTARRLMGWLIGGALAAIAIGLVVFFAGGDVLITDRFFGQITQLGPHDRFTRPWAHANIAALAVVASAPGLVALPPRWWGPAALAVTLALVLTYSRGGALALVVAGATWIFLATGDRRRAMSCVAVLAGAAVVVAMTSPGYSIRTAANESLAWWGAEITAPDALEIRGDGPAPTAAIAVTNVSDVAWPSEGDDRVQLSVRFVRPTTAEVWSEQRWDLARDLRPEESIALQVVLTPLVPPGRYNARWDLVIDEQAYFREFSGSPAVVSIVDVLEAPGAPVVEPVGELVGNRSRVGRATLWRAAITEFIAHPVLGVGPNRFAASAEAFAVSHAHHLVLEPMATWGLPATLALLGLFGGAVARALRAARRRGDHLTRSLAVGLIAVAAHGLVDWPLVHVSAAIPIGILCGLAWTRQAVVPDSVVHAERSAGS